MNKTPLFERIKLIDPDLPCQPVDNDNVLIACKVIVRGGQIKHVEDLLEENGIGFFRDQEGDIIATNNVNAED